MKKNLLIVIIFLLFVPDLRAQYEFFPEPHGTFSGGLVCGANFTQVDGDTYYGYNKVGLNIGGMVYAHFNQKFGASMELLYSQKGSRGETITESPSIGTYVAKYFMNLNYVEVPFMLHYVQRRFDYEAGISYAYLIRSSEWVETDQPVIIDPVLNRFNTTDLEYILGLTYKLYKNCYANARFQYSIIDIRPTSRVPVGFSYGDAGQFNNMFAVRILYLF